MWPRNRPGRPQRVCEVIRRSRSVSVSTQDVFRNRVGRGEVRYNTFCKKLLKRGSIPNGICRVVSVVLIRLNTAEFPVWPGFDPQDLDSKFRATVEDDFEVVFTKIANCGDIKTCIEVVQLGEDVLVQKLSRLAVHMLFKRCAVPIWT